MGEFDGRVTRPASEISDHVSCADISGRVEGLGGKSPLVHGLVARQSLLTDVEPVHQKQVLVRHDRLLIKGIWHVTVARHRRGLLQSSLQAKQTWKKCPIHGPPGAVGQNVSSWHDSTV